MELYESRCASLQRFVAMCVIFHEMGSRVQAFFPSISLGFLGYRTDRTHSMLRIATTASPVSGADVRERIERLQSIHVIEHATKVISAAWYRYRHNQTKKLFRIKSQSKLISRRRSSSMAGDGDHTENSSYSDQTTEPDIVSASVTPRAPSFAAGSFPME